MLSQWIYRQTKRISKEFVTTTPTTPTFTLFVVVHGPKRRYDSTIDGHAIGTPAVMLLKRHQSAAATPLIQPQQLPQQQQPVLPTIPADSIHTTHQYDASNMASTVTDKQSVEQPLVIPSNQIFMGKKMPDIEEQIAIMLVCLKSGHIDRAHTILKHITKNKPIHQSRFIDTNLHNAFIEAYIMQKGRPNTRQALYWFDDMKKSGAKPNISTYAILIKGMLRDKTTGTAKLLLRELLKEGHDINALIANRHLSDEDLKALNLFRQKGKTASKLDIQKQPEESNITVDMLDAIKPSNSPIKSIDIPTSSPNNLPEARSTNVLGLRLLKRALDPIAAKDIDRYERQLRLEEQALLASIERLKSASDEQFVGMKMSSISIRRLMWQWHQELEQARAYQVIGTKKETTRNVCAPFIILIDAERLSILTIQHMLRLHSTGGIVGGMKTARAVSEVGRAIEQEYCAEQLRAKDNSFLKAKRMNLHALYSSGKLFDIDEREKQAKVLADSPNENWLPNWPTSVRIKLGSLLSSLLMTVAKIPITQKDPATNTITKIETDAFFHTYIFAQGHRTGAIRMHPKLSEMFSRDSIKEALDPRITPRPWVRFDSGGYLSKHSVCMRIKESPEQYRYLKEASNQGRIGHVLNGLDVLGKNPNVALYAWNSGKEYPCIPSLMESLDLPPKPEIKPDNYEETRKWHKLETDFRNHHSQRCDVNYKIEIARSFVGETIYFPHNLDFRGRAYPIPPLFNHLGNDICRGLLLFAEGKPLGEKGLNWLKIQLASLAGYDKHSFTERIQFVDLHLEDIFDSADNPIHGRQWWLKAEDAWQALAACVELTEALRSPNPLEYKSRLPIHQDGTCNGLQHYAALGGDVQGATQVNLLPSDFPQDVYTGVCNLVNKAIDDQAANGVEEAVALKGKINRKIVKQTVMTNVYGVTFVGARDQIANRLKELDDLPEENIWRYSTYLTHQVFNSLGEMFEGARALQDWLSESARRIAKSIPNEAIDAKTSTDKKSTSKTITKKSSGKPTRSSSANNRRNQLMTSVIWTTPLGLPIVQPYRKSNRRLVRTVLQSITVSDPNVETPVNAQKQRTAFPPNFVHSLDATHMILSAIACQKHGLTFAAVHDSYWTHACDIDMMSALLRDQFIELHSQPIMENLRNEFIERYAGYKMPASILALFTTEDTSTISDISDSTSTEATTTTIVDPMAPADEHPDEDEEMTPIDTISATTDNATSTTTTTSTTAITSKSSWIDIEFPPLPPRGQFDVKSVSKSSYFFH
ncbi:hypothetical protein BDF22DRAFT_663366 [Syncephalis plumigaleata]|nr:hypothetical protein BDF22DRAFT_663366 [Syncephalis plumigaleata]